MFEKLDLIEERYEELAQQIADPELINRQDEWQTLVKEHASLEEIVTKYREYKKVKEEIEAAQQLLEETDDREFLQMLEQELDELKEKQETLEQEIRMLLLPKDPLDEKNVVMEIRSGAGGEEAALLARSSSACTAVMPSARAGRLKL